MNHTATENAADIPCDAEREVLAESIRQLIAVCTSASASTADLRMATDLVAAATSALGPAPSFDEHRSSTENGRRPTLNPYDSAGNPLAPPLRVLRSANGEYLAELTLSPAYEGPPGRAHGGVVTGILDHASGFALQSLGIIAMSVSLTINLHDATPYGQPLTVSSRISGRDGRKIWVDAALATADGHHTATCRTLMIELADRPAWAESRQQALKIF